MNPFNYSYHSQVFSSVVEHFLESGKHRYRVSLPDGHAIILVSGFPKADDKPIWVQQVRPGERVLDHSLVQVMGEALEHTVLFKNTRPILSE